MRKHDDKNKMRKTRSLPKISFILNAMLIILCGMFLFSPDIQAQVRTDMPYVLPHTIFVGDRGRLVVPLDPSFGEIAPFVLEGQNELPQTPDLQVLRIELDRRGGSSRLLIDFIPYAVGDLSFPALEFLLSEDEENTKALPPLGVQVTSILSSSNMALSQPAPPLAVPGTTLLVYGTGILVLLVVFLGIGFFLLGPRRFRELCEWILRRYRLNIMMRFLRRLKLECSLDKSGNPEHYLTILSGKMREFLSFFTGFNCQSLAAVEFLELPLEESVLDPERLFSLFRAWDTLRFSGIGLSMDDLFKAIDDVHTLLALLDKAEKEKPLPKPIPAAAISTGGSL